MMNLLSAVAALALAQGASGIVSEQELARTLTEQRKAGEWFTNFAKGSDLQCRVTKSTGDHELDAIFCSVVERCLKDFDFEDPAFGDCMIVHNRDAFSALVRTRAGVPEASQGQ